MRETERAKKYLSQLGAHANAPILGCSKVIVSQAEISVHVTVYALPAWAIFLLGIALIVGLSEKRRASIFVDLFILTVVGIYILQIVIFTLQPQLYRPLLLLFGFIPIRYVVEFGPQWSPFGWPARLWTPFTYTLLHQNGPHLFGNCMALFIFGRTVAWRIGGRRFLALFFLAGATGALLHLIFHWGSPKPLIGASAGAFGIMATTFRFVPAAQDRLKALFWPDKNVRNLPISRFRDMLSERRSLVYILVCLVIYPLGLTALLVGTAGNVAVLAHVGGFAVGLFGIGYFDRKSPQVDVLPSDEATSAKANESFGMKLLRFIAVAMMVIGIILGALSYILGVLTYFLKPFQH